MLHSSHVAYMAELNELNELKRVISRSLGQTPLSYCKRGVNHGLQRDTIDNEKIEVFTVGGSNISLLGNTALIAGDDQMISDMTSLNNVNWMISILKLDSDVDLTKILCCIRSTDFRRMFQYWFLQVNFQPDRVSEVRQI